MAEKIVARTLTAWFFIRIEGEEFCSFIFNGLSRKVA